MCSLLKSLSNSLKYVKPYSRLNYMNVRSISQTNQMRDIFKIQDENDFKEKVLNNKKPVIIDFYATWCGPCKVLEPRLETIVGGKTDKLDLAKVDVDENETIASQYQVSSIPMVLAISGGKVVDQFIGLKDEDQLRAFVAKVLNE